MKKNNYRGILLSGEISEPFITMVFRNAHSFFWYSGFYSVKTADKTPQTIRNGAMSLLDNPNAGTEMQDNTGRRKLYIPFGKNNYTVRYKPDFEAKVIRVLRIWHSREERS